MEKGEPFPTHLLGCWCGLRIPRCHRQDLPNDPTQEACGVLTPELTNKYSIAPSTSVVKHYFPVHYIYFASDNEHSETPRNPPPNERLRMSAACSMAGHHDTLRLSSIIFKDAEREREATTCVTSPPTDRPTDLPYDKSSTTTRDLPSPLASVTASPTQKSSRPIA